MANLFKPQVNYLLKNGPTEIGSEATLVSEKSSTVIWLNPDSCIDRFEVRFKRFEGSIDMVIMFDYKHPYNAPDFIITKNGQDEAHDESYIDYDSLESLKKWDLQDQSSLTRVLGEIFMVRTLYSYTLVRSIVPQELQIARDIDEIFGPVLRSRLFDITMGVDGRLRFCYPHALSFLGDNSNPCPICCLYCELDFSMPTEPARVRFKIIHASEELSKLLSKAVLGKYNCVTPFSSWLDSINESFKKAAAQEHKYFIYLKEFANVFKCPLFCDPPEYKVMAFGISDPKYNHPAILKSTFIKKYGMIYTHMPLFRFSFSSSFFS